MSTPLIFIFLPLFIALILVFLRRKPKLSNIIGAVSAFLFALVAHFLPEDLSFNLGSLSIELTQSFNFLGRSLDISHANLVFVSLAFIICGLWMLGSAWLDISIWFRPISLAVTALLIAALGVNPFLYAALLIELVVLLFIPLLSPKGEETNTGVMRFLIFQTMALPPILLTGWMLSGIETAPSNSPLILRAAILVFLGFALWLAFIPFHTWLPIISENSHPWVVSFILLIMPTTIMIFLLTFFDRYAWLRNLPLFYEILRFLSTIMILVGGLLLTIEKNLGRAFGYAVIVETGFSILAMSLNPQGGLAWFSMLLLPRTLGYWLWSFSLSLIKQRFKELSFTNVTGLFHDFPFASSGLIVGQLSIAGLPLFASFPVKRLIWFNIGSPDLVNALLIFIGSSGLFVFVINSLIHFLKQGNETTSTEKPIEPMSHKIIITTSILLLVLFGILPQIILPHWTKLLLVFERFPILP